MAKFNKGSNVAVVADWDRKGTVFIRRAIVQAWGAKIVRLRDANTNEMFNVAIGANHTDRHDYKIVADDNNDALECVAIEMAKNIIVHENTRFARCLAGNHGEAYDRAIRKDIEALHEPRVHWR